MTTVKRQQETKRIFNEGYAARVEGAKLSSCPQEYVGTEKRVHWDGGWNFADSDLLFERNNQVKK